MSVLRYNYLRYVFALAPALHQRITVKKLFHYIHTNRWPALTGAEWSFWLHDVQRVHCIE